jgi:tetratricopeptide (TPR) repeat protein
MGLLFGTGCLGDAIKANQRQLDQQQTQLDQLKQQIEALQSQRPTYSTTAPAPGGCDESVMHEASRKGGDRFAANDFAHALGYYQDAVAACAKNGRAQLNLARTYEALGERSNALTCYKLAADESGADADADTASEARAALARLQK